MTVTWASADSKSIWLASGIGVLITDHNLHETLDLIDRAYIIYDGQVIMEGTPKDIVQDTNVRRVYLGERFSLVEMCTSLPILCRNNLTE